MTLVQLGLAIRASNLMTHADVKSGEDVLILCEKGYTEPRIAEAIGEGASKRGATVSTIYCKPLLPGGTEEPPKPVAAAIKSTDVLIELFSHPLDHTLTHIEALFEYGLRYIMVLGWASTREIFSEASLWPVQAFYELRRRMYEKMSRAKVARVTNPRGSDIKVMINPYHVKGGFGPIKHPGEFGIFPPGSILIHPDSTGDGVTYFDGFHMFGNTRRPIKFTFQKGWCTKVEGGREARQLQREVAMVDNWGYFDELTVGLNPKVRLQLELGKGMESLMSAGLVHIGVGDSKMDGGRVYSKMHLDGWIRQATFVVDDETLVKDGRLLLLDDEDVKAAVSRYGDPQELLRQLR